MKRNVYLVFGVILGVRGVIISDFMSRNPTYDNRATLATDIISTLIFRSSMHCASHCTRNDECKSIMFNKDTHSCQLLSVHMSDTGPQIYSGWLYYEKKIDCSIWHERLGHWYILDTNERTFNDSRSFCASLSPKSYVIEVDSQAENDWLVELAVTYCGMAGRYWLNGYDTDNSGTFTWIDSQTPTNYTNWDNDQPNDHEGKDQKCIESKIDDGGRWNDLSCLSMRWVVCKRNS